MEKVLVFGRTVARVLGHGSIFLIFLVSSESLEQGPVQRLDGWGTIVHFVQAYYRSMRKASPESSSLAPKRKSPTRIGMGLRDPVVKFHLTSKSFFVST
jgi:hypothetical protein